MARKEIIWSSRATSEFKEILEFFIQRNGNPNYSLKLLSEIQNITNILSQNEFIGRLTSNKVTRVIPMKVYLIFYEVHDTRIEIVSFWDNRQNPENSHTS